MTTNRSNVEHPVRPPAQKRSRESLERIYNATNELLKKTTFDQITVTQISAQSSVSVGSIYQRFGSKDNLLWSLYDAYITEATERIEALREQHKQTSLEERWLLVIEDACKLFWLHRGIVRSLLLKFWHSSDSIPFEYMERIESVYESLEEFIHAACEPRINQSQVRFALSVMLSACRERVLFLAFDAEVNGNSGDRRFARDLSPALIALTSLEDS